MTSTTQKANLTIKICVLKDLLQAVLTRKNTNKITIFFI